MVFYWMSFHSNRKACSSKKFRTNKHCATEKSLNLSYLFSSYQQGYIFIHIITFISSAQIFKTRHAYHCRMNEQGIVFVSRSLIKILKRRVKHRLFYYRFSGNIANNTRHHKPIHVVSSVYYRWVMYMLCRVLTHPL